MCSLITANALSSLGCIVEKARASPLSLTSRMRSLTPISVLLFKRVPIFDLPLECAAPRLHPMLRFSPQHPYRQDVDPSHGDDVGPGQDELRLLSTVPVRVTLKAVAHVEDLVGYLED